MLSWFQKSFWVPYDAVDCYSTVSAAQAAIAAYCACNHWSCQFLSDEEVSIEGKQYKIYRGYEPGSRGCYGIKCQER